MVNYRNTKDAMQDDDLLHLRCFLYGRPGSGKTFFASTMEKPFFICVDQGLLYFKMRGINIDFAEVETLDDINQVLNDISNGTAAQGCKSIVLDGFDLITDFAIDQVRQQTGVQFFRQKEWGMCRDRLKGIIFTMLRLSKYYNICVITGDMFEKDDVRGKLYGLPDTLGKLRMDIGKSFDLYLYCVQEEHWDNGEQKKEFNLYSVSYDVIFGAKDRTGVLDSKEPNDFKVIYSKFKTELEAGRLKLSEGMIEPVDPTVNNTVT